MCDINRIRKLKNASRSFANNLKKINPLDICPKDHVSSTGLTYSDMAEKLNKIAQCASIIELKSDYKKIGNTFEQHMSVSAANFCKQHTICPICADRLQSRRRARFNDPIKKQAGLVTEGKRFAYIVTYTVQDGVSLAERLEHLRESKKVFRKMGQRRGRHRSGGEAAKFRSAISTVEIKRGSGSGLWHIHSHDLVFTDKPIDYRTYNQLERNRLKSQYGHAIPRSMLDAIALNRVQFQGESVAASKISTEWLRATAGDSMGISVDPLVHVPRNAPGKKKRMLAKKSFEDSICYQSREVLKYITKPTNHLPTDTFEIIADTYNKRMTATYGEFRGIPGDDYDNQARPDQDTYVLVWDKKTNKYGEPVPGRIRDMVANEEREHETRSTVGKILGAYRRHRKTILSQRELLGNGLNDLLDDSKNHFRRRVAAIWSMHRQAESASKRIVLSGCDKYSQVLALNGNWIPGSDHRDIYAAAFS